MKRFPSIKKNSEFQKVYRNGKSYANKLLIMYISRSERPDTRIGISVSKTSYCTAGKREFSFTQG